MLSFVIPAKAGIQGCKHWRNWLWTPAFAGVTNTRVEASPHAILHWAPL